MMMSFCDFHRSPERHDASRRFYCCSSVSSCVILCQISPTELELENFYVFAYISVYTIIVQFYFFRFFFGIMTTFEWPLIFLSSLEFVYTTFWISRVRLFIYRGHFLVSCSFARPIFEMGWNEKSFQLWQLFCDRLNSKRTSLSSFRVKNS